MSRFHRAFYAFMRTIIKPYFRLTDYSWQRYDPVSPNYIVLTNHNTNWDFFLTGLVLKKHMYFVASEHILRGGFKSKLIKFLGDPIPRRKGASGDETYNLILDKLRSGENVCMAAEGNRSFSGETGFISKRTAQLVKESGAGLITFTVRGGYFQNPRWSKGKRKGPTWGQVENEYTAEALSAMTVDEVYCAITKDLYVNAYDDQETRQARYECDNPAESLETALFYCPECGSFSSMASSGDKFFCKNCGLSLRFDDFGYFSASAGGEAPFRTVTGWYHAENKALKEFVKSAQPGTLLFSDDGVRLSEVIPGVGTVPVAEGTVSLYTDAIKVSGFEDIKMSTVEKISIVLRDIILFTAGGKYYELKPVGATRSMLKYVMAAMYLMGKDYK